MSEVIIENLWSLLIFLSAHFSFSFISIRHSGLLWLLTLTPPGELGMFSLILSNNFHSCAYCSFLLQLAM